MAASDIINEIIDGYISKSEAVIDKAGPAAGLFGFGEDPRKNACHEEFYNALETAVSDICQSGPSEDEAYSAAMAILSAHIEKKCPNMCMWMLSASEKLAVPLFGFLSPASREKIRIWYDDVVPKRARLPYEKEVYRALSE